MAIVFIGVGSSIDKLKNIRLGLELIKKEFGEIKCSSLFESKSIGFTGENFYNMVVEFCTNIPPKKLIQKLKQIEIKCGRPLKTIKFAPRTLDLDLLLFDEVIDLSIDLPRSEITKNAFVLKPLAEIAPDTVHPVVKKTFGKLWENYPKNDQSLWKIEINTENLTQE